MSDEKRQRRTPTEIAQAHAERAVKAAEKAQAKVDKAQAKIDQATAEHQQALEGLGAARAEADYRQSHPLLKKAEAAETQDELGGTDSPF